MKNYFKTLRNIVAPHKENWFQYLLSTFLLISVGQALGYVLVKLIFDNIIRLCLPVLHQSAGYQTSLMYFYNIGIWLVFYFYCKGDEVEEDLLETISHKHYGNNIWMFIAGVFAGGLTNGICAWFAYRNGDIQLSYNGIQWISVIVIFITILIQASGEEIFCRGYLYQKLLWRYKKPAVAILGNSILFAMLHLMNPGITVTSFVNLILAGLFPSLIIYYTGSMWFAFGEHLMWNYMQNIILGLPNSGLTNPFSIFTLTNAKDSFFYNVGFGIEGSGFSIIAIAVACFVVLVYGLIVKHKETTVYRIEWVAEEREKKSDEDFFNNLCAQFVIAYEKEKKKLNKKGKDISWIEYVEKQNKQTVSTRKMFSMAYIPATLLAIVLAYLEEGLTKTLILRGMIYILVINLASWLYCKLLMGVVKSRERWYQKCLDDEKQSAQQQEELETKENADE